LRRNACIDKNRGKAEKTTTINAPKLTKNEVTVQPLILKLLKLSKAQKNLQGSYAEFALLIGV